MSSTNISSGTFQYENIANQTVKLQEKRERKKNESMTKVFMSKSLVWSLSIFFSSFIFIWAVAWRIIKKKQIFQLCKENIWSPRCVRTITGSSLLITRTSIIELDKGDMQWKLKFDIKRSSHFESSIVDTLLCVLSYLACLSRWVDENFSLIK